MIITNVIKSLVLCFLCIASCFSQRSNMAFIESIYTVNKPNITYPTVHLLYQNLTLLLQDISVANLPRLLPCSLSLKTNAMITLLLTKSMGLGVRYVRFVSPELCTWFTLCCIEVWISHDSHTYPSRLLLRHWGNPMIAPVPVKQPWWIWVNYHTCINQGWGQVLFEVLESSTSTFSYLQVQVQIQVLRVLGRHQVHQVIFQSITSQVQVLW